MKPTVWQRPLDENLRTASWRDPNGGPWDAALGAMCLLLVPWFLLYLTTPLHIKFSSSSKGHSGKRIIVLLELFHSFSLKSKRRKQEERELLSDFCPHLETQWESMSGRWGPQGQYFQLNLLGTSPSRVPHSTIPFPETFTSPWAMILFPFSVSHNSFYSGALHFVTKDREGKDLEIILSKPLI